MDWLGQKTNARFYDYDENQTPIPSDIAAKIAREITGVEPMTFAPDKNIKTCIYPMINEALKILKENKAQRPSDIDIVWLNGFGWPADKGGPINYGDTIGAGVILAKMEELGQEDPVNGPAQILNYLAKTGGKFSDIYTGGLKTTKF